MSESLPPAGESSGLTGVGLLGRFSPRVQQALLVCASLLLVIGSWEALVRWLQVPAFILPPPSAISLRATPNPDPEPPLLEHPPATNPAASINMARRIPNFVGGVKQRKC